MVSYYHCNGWSQNYECGTAQTGLRGFLKIKIRELELETGRERARA